MKKNAIIILILITIFNTYLNSKEKKTIFLKPSDRIISDVVNGIKYESGNWEHPDYSKPFRFYGNHRFVIRTRKKAKYVKVHIPWRRGDENPKKKGVVIVNAETLCRIDNILVKIIKNESGDFIFEPEKNSDLYFVYYLPHKSTGGYYPKVKYLSQDGSADPKWIGGYKKLSTEIKKSLPVAKVVAAQSIDDFHSFFPMEIIASQRELESFIKSNLQEFYLFPEYRENSIKMNDFLPLLWIKRGLRNGITDNVKEGEFYTFQIGVYSPEHNLSDLQISLSDLRSDNGSKIKTTGLECFNTSGIGPDGKFFKKKLNIKAGKVQALWFGIDIPPNAKEGLYRGKCIVDPKDLNRRSIDVEIRVLPETADDRGDNHPEKMSRLRWLNSKLGSDKNFIVKPFLPVLVKEKVIKILGRSVVIGKNGLPEEIRSFFSDKMTSLKQVSEPILAKPVFINVIQKGCNPEKWKSVPFRINQDFRGEADWNVVSESNNFILKTDGHIEYDGMLFCKMKLIAKNNVKISDIILEIPMEPDASKYMVGLGKKGGKRPENILWKWDVNFHQEGVWLGNVNKGLQYVLRDEKYERPLNTNFYHNKPLVLPGSWGNGGKGGIRIGNRKNGSVIVENFSGPRSMGAGEILNFNVRFLITPFKIIDLKKHFKTRFVHKYLPVDEVVKLGGTVVNIHHATEINPYINYPFFNLKKMKCYIEEAHKKGIKVKLYNTIRELSYKAYELFALKSLGSEIFNDGDGGGHSWLREHLRSHYHSAWHATNVNDAAILDKGTSRWANYYIEGINWLAKNQKIDGIYLDDIAFGRKTVKRMATVLNKQRKDVIIDLHSANQFNSRDGFVNSVFLYMEHLPYISRLWFGEYFEYNLGPDYWLTEVSGIPFGLTGEMLEKGGHTYRGMVYGMTTRVYGKYNPGELWKLFDKFDIMGSEMFGYWVKNSPVKTFAKNIRSTIYMHKDRLMIAIGSWSTKDEDVVLEINWEKIGFSKKGSVLFAPEIKGLQKSQVFDIDKPVVVKKNKGLILILEKNNRLLTGLDLNGQLLLTNRTRFLNYN